MHYKYISKILFIYILTIFNFSYSQSIDLNLRDCEGIYDCKKKNPYLFFIKNPSNNEGLILYSYLPVQITENGLMGLKTEAKWSKINDNNIHSQEDENLVILDKIDYLKIIKEREGIKAQYIKKMPPFILEDFIKTHHLEGVDDFNSVRNLALNEYLKEKLTEFQESLMKQHSFEFYNFGHLIKLISDLSPLTEEDLKISKRDEYENLVIKNKVKVNYCFEQFLNSNNFLLSNTYKMKLTLKAEGTILTENHFNNNFTSEEYKIAENLSTCLDVQFRNIQIPQSDVEVDLLIDINLLFNSLKEL